MTAFPWENDPIVSSNAPWANDPEVAAETATPPNDASVPLDVAKQVGTGLVTGTEAIPAAPARLADLAGQGLEWLGDKVGFSGAFSPEAQKQQADLKALIAQNRGEGIANYLPKPETTAGKYARTAAEFVPSALAMPGNLAANATFGAASGLGSEAGGQLTEGTAAEPYARLGGALVGGALAPTKTAQALAARAERSGKALPEINAEALRGAASPVYKAQTALANEVTVPNGAGEQMAADIATELHPLKLRSENAERTYRQLNKLGDAKDLNDISIVRDKLRDTKYGISNETLVKVGGQDSEAAGLAMRALDKEMDALSPGWVAKNAEADANWAAAKRVKTVEDYAEEGKKFASFDKKQSRKKGFTKTELALIKRAETGGPLGTVLNTFGATLNPAHSGLAAAMSAATHIPTAILTGGASVPFQIAGAVTGAAADAGARALRNRAYNQMINKLGARSPLAQQVLPPVQPLSAFRHGSYAAPLLADPSYQRQLLLGGGS